ncbi:MAG: Hint domain-containing protein [Pseudomonadota bacterium]
MLIDLESFEAAPGAGETTGSWASIPNLTAGSGIVAGTKVASNLGWRSVECIEPGDKVLTYDHGLQVVTGVTRSFLWIGEKDCPESAWPLLVPEGALGNQSDLWIVPEQHVLIESEIAERVYGDPFVVIPALSLEGHKGITRSCPKQVIEVLQLEFDRDEVVFANMGALFFCPKQQSATERLTANASGAANVAPRKNEAAAPLRYVPLSLEHADILVCHLGEDYGDQEKPDDSRDTSLQNYAA